ncbi:MAG: hypothetical protein K8F90_00280 [Hyphomicrobiales bacterium]|nr:hypothetical protein [Hyphomicrobiales bacterium]
MKPEVSFFELAKLPKDRGNSRFPALAKAQIFVVYLTKKAEAYEGFCRLVTLQTVLGPQAKGSGDCQFNRIANVLQKLVETEGRQFESTVIVDELINLKLFSEDDEI